MSETLLEERAKTHGDFANTSRIFVRILAATGPVGNPDLTMAHAAIINKLARIASGDCNEVDHWRDIAGYATGAVKILEAQQGQEVTCD